MPYLACCVLALDPNSARTRCELGRAHYMLDENAKARRMLEEALALNPYYQLGWQYLLRLLQMTKAQDGARWAERAHQTNPANFALALLGVSLYPVGQRAPGAETAAGFLRADLSGRRATRGSRGLPVRRSATPPALNWPLLPASNCCGGVVKFFPIRPRWRIY